MKTKPKPKPSYWWPGMDTEIDIHIKSCDKCQRTRKDKRLTTFASPLPQCNLMYLFGPLKTMPSGKNFIMYIGDAFLQYTELITVPEKCVPALASALFSTHLCRHRLPLEIVSDKVKEFCNEIVDTLLKLMGIKKTNATPSHPQTNAQAEVNNVTIAACLKIQVLSSTLYWEQYIPI